MGACTLISFLSPNTIANQFFSIFVIPFFAKKQKHIAPIYIFYLLNMPALSFQINIGGIYLFDWYNYSSLTAGALIYNSVKFNKTNNNIDSSVISIAIIVLIYTIIGVRGTSFTNMIRVTVDLTCSIILPFILIRQSINSIDDVKRFLIGLASATASLSGLAIYEARVGWPIYTSLSSHYGLIIGGGNSVKMRGGLLRSAGPFPEPTSFALWLALGSFVVVVSSWMFKSKFHRIIASSLCLYGMISPQSRGAILGVFTALFVFYIISAKPSQKIAGIFGCIIAACSIYIAALSIPSVGSMFGINSIGTVSRDYRQDLFSRGIQESYNHPIVGQSVSNVMIALSDLKQGEGIIDFVNTYLFVLLITGYFGFLLFSFSLSYPVLILLYKAHRGFESSIFISLMVSIMTMLAFTSLVGRTVTGVSIILAIMGIISSSRFKKQSLLGGKVNKRQINLIRESIINNNHTNNTLI